MGFIKNQKGFTLIEVMVALVIGLVLIIAFSGAIVNSFKAELRMDDRMEASRIVDSIIEQLKNKNLNDLNSDDNINDIEDIETSIKETFEKDIDISDSKNDNPDITVKWKEEKTTDGLYLVTIKWNARNYKLEALLAGD